MQIERDGDRGTLVGVETPSADRVEAFCPHFGVCGGCQLQHLDRPFYESFKTGLVVAALEKAGLDVKSDRFVDASGRGRRRATLHARKEGAGYMRLRSHQVADIAHCPILVPELASRAPAIARAVEAVIGEADVAFTASDSGIDVAVRTQRRQARAERLMPLLGEFGLARLAMNGETLLQAQPPTLAIGRASVNLPVNAFLQATAAAEQTLGEYALAGIGKAKRVADLFCGVGTFAFRLAEQAQVTAFDSDRGAITALQQAARHASGLKTVTGFRRDLFRDPLTRFEFDGFDAVVLDPPRAGAMAQVEELCASKIGQVVMIACDAGTFARDAERLVQAGFTLRDLQIVDQFAWSTHVEIAATFTR
ncbi:putative RNA methyltransferase [Devosia pacifica]|uniref:RNA methyltransferase n=1 Tax=Devosia pacifica TaxID=1335967 RepID=A0A918S4K2_9HYPH|nr:putative RNA methyltransferase [Devosia pacifica]